MAPHIVLEEIGAPYEAVQIDLKKGEHKTPAYTAVNPRQRVPALRLDDGQVLTEDIAILAFLAARVPGQRLLPTDAVERARVCEWLSFLATGPHVTFGEFLHPDVHVTEPACMASLKTKAGERFDADIADIEAHIRAPFLVGESFTIADAHLFIFYVWGRRRHSVDETKTPRLFAWGATMLARPSVQRMLAAEDLSIR